MYTKSCVTRFEGHLKDDVALIPFPVDWDHLQSGVEILLYVFIWFSITH